MGSSLWQDATPRNQPWVIIALIAGLVTLGAVPLDVMLPSYPSLAKHFARPVADIAWSISVFALGFAFAQLFVGPMSDHWGRKRVLIVALVLATLGSIGTMFTHEFATFLACRVIQAIGCACFVLAQAIVQDQFVGRAATRARIYITTGNGVLIAISPICGTALEWAMGWRGSFQLFVLISLALLVVACTNYVDAPRRSAHPGAVIFYAREYGRMFSDAAFVGYWLIGSIAFSCHFAFIVASPIVFLEQMGIDATTYSLILLVYGIAYIVAGSIASKLISLFTERQVIYAGIVAIAVAGMSMFVLQFVWRGAPASIVLPMLICTLGTSMVRPCAASLAMSRFSTSAGTASAAGSTIRMLVAGLLSGLTAALGTSVTGNLAVLLLGGSVALVLLLGTVARGVTSTTPPPPGRTPPSTSPGAATGPSTP